MISSILIVTNGMAQNLSTRPFNTIGSIYRHYGKTTTGVDEEKDLWQGINECDSQTISDSFCKMEVVASLPLKEILITSTFGMRQDPMNHSKKRFHTGLDLKARYEEVFSMLPGVITETGYSAEGGYFVTIQHMSFVCSYLHLSSILVQKGDLLEAGSVVAISGNSGKRTTGPHLHISCRTNTTGNYINPLSVIQLISEHLHRLNSN